MTTFNPSKKGQIITSNHESNLRYQKPRQQNIHYFRKKYLFTFVFFFGICALMHRYLRLFRLKNLGLSNYLGSSRVVYKQSTNTHNTCYSIKEKSCEKLRSFKEFSTLIYGEDYWFLYQN